MAWIPLLVLCIVVVVFSKKPSRSGTRLPSLSEKSREEEDSGKQDNDMTSGGQNDVINHYFPRNDDKSVYQIVSTHIYYFNLFLKNKDKIFFVSDPRESECVSQNGED